MAFQTQESLLRGAAKRIAKKYGVDPELFVRLVQKESNFDPEAKGAAGEIGLTQIMYKTGLQPGLGVKPIEDRGDALDNLRFGAEYLAALLEYYQGDYRKALMAYNGGMGNVDKGTVSNAAQNYANDLLSNQSGRPGFDPGTSVPNDQMPVTPKMNTGSPATTMSGSIGNMQKTIADLFNRMTPPMQRPPTIQNRKGFGQMSGMSPLSSLKNLPMLNPAKMSGLPLSGIASLRKGKK